MASGISRARRRSFAGPWPRRRGSRPLDADLFVFTFSRHTLPDRAEPVAGEPFVFTQFSGEPQCFLTEHQLVSELEAAGFSPNPEMPIQELNRRAPGVLVAGAAPVIYEGAFRYTGPGAT